MKKTTNYKSKTKTNKPKADNPFKEKIKDVEFIEEAKRLYYAYGVAVNEERAIPCDIDGLKPIQRRGLYATHNIGGNSKAKFSKAVVYVGTTLASYHPHGDSSAYGAFVTMVNSPIPLINGEGNWGSFSDKSFAAMRYTEMRLSDYSDLIFFDKFYLPVMTMVPNFDDSKEEPLHLVSLLPNLLINGGSGIGVGVSTTMPSFSLASVSQVLTKALRLNKPITAKSCAALELTTLYDGSPIENKEEMKRLMETGRGRISFQSTFEVVDKHTVHFTKFAPFNLVKALEKIETLKDVVSVNDISDVTDRHGRIEICFKKSMSSAEVDRAALAIANDQFGATLSFDMSVTKRFVNEKGQGAAKLQPASVVKIFNDWIDYRIDLEKKACTYWIEQRRKEIERLDLMVLAVLNRDFIIKALNKKLDDDQLAAYIAKGLKITVEQANTILDLKIRALKSLEEDKLRGKIKELKTEVAGYKQRIKKPTEYIYQHVKNLVKKIEIIYPG